MRTIENLLRAYRHNNQTTALLLMALVLLSPNHVHSEEQVFAKAPKAFAETAPSPIYHLATWSSEQGGVNILPDGDPSTKKAVHSFWEWAGIAIDSDWLAGKSTSVKCSKAEFEGRDVIRAAWVANGYTIEVSQTATIFLVKLTPTNSLARAHSESEMLQQMKSLSSKIFVKTGRRYTSQGVAVVVPDLNETITKDTLNEGQVLHFQKEGILLGVPVGKKSSELAEEWDNWHRQVHSWTDGRSVGFYFQKRPFGSMIIPRGTYPPGLDMIWFRE